MKHRIYHDSNRANRTITVCVPLYFHLNHGSKSEYNPCYPLVLFKNRHPTLPKISLDACLLFPFIQPLNNQPGNRGIGSLTHNRAHFKRNHGHTVHHTRGFVLPNGIAAVFSHLQKALGTITAHTGQDNPHGVAARCLSHRLEQHINRRTVPADLFPHCALDVISAGILRKAHVLIAGGNKGRTGLYPLAALRFFYGKAANAV